MKSYKAIYTALLTATLLNPASTVAAEQGQYLKTVDASFDQVFQDLQDEVINKGLVIDYTGHVDTMLQRTAEVSGVEKSPYLKAKYFHFCSSSLTHEAAAADTRNIAMCPYLIFAYETQAKPGTVSIGFHEPNLTSSAESQAVASKIRDLLRGIVEASINNN